MKTTKNISSLKFDKSKYEELIRLRAKILISKLKIKSKKEINLRDKKEAKNLKAKKQWLLKYSKRENIR